MEQFATTIFRAAMLEQCCDSSKQCQNNAESYPEFSVVFLESQNPERDDSLGLKETAYFQAGGAPRLFKRWIALSTG